MQNTARYLPAEEEQEMFQGRASFGKVAGSGNKQAHYLSGGQVPERLNTFASLTGMLPNDHAAEVDGNFDAQAQGSTLKKPKQRDLNCQIEMYTDTVQRNVFADMNQPSKSRGVSPDYNSQLMSVIKLKDESDRDELQKYIDQFYQKSKVLSNDNQTI